MFALMVNGPWNVLARTPMTSNVTCLQVKVWSVYGRFFSMTDYHLTRSSARQLLRRKPLIKGTG